MRDGWDIFLATGKVTDYLKAKEQEQMGSRTYEEDRVISDLPPNRNGQDANALCRADESCRIM